MYLGAIGTWLSDELGGQQISLPGIDAQIDLGAARFPFALLAIMSLPLIYLILLKLVGERVALLAALFVALDPFLIAHARIVHADSPLSIFMFLSTLLLLLGLTRMRMVVVGLSGIAAGLALLSKAPGVILFGFTIAATALFMGRSLTSVTARAAIRSLTRLLAPWFGAVLITVVLLWPALWVAPLETLAYSWERTELAVSFAHNPQLGYVLAPLYYPKAIVLFMGTVTFPLFVLAVLLLLVQLRHRWQAFEGSTTPFLLLLFIGLYLFAATITAKKGERFILPAFFAMDTLAAWGFFALWRLVARRSRLRGRRGPQAAVAGVLLAFSASNLVVVHPYYLAAYNQLLPKPVEAKMGWGEGLELAADYLGRIPGDEIGVVASWYPEVLSAFYGGPVVGVGERDRPGVTHVVLYRGMLGRAEDSEATDALLEFENREPEKVIFINGLEYVWIHREGESASALVAGTRFRGRAQLLAYEVTPERPAAGAELLVILYWKSIDLMEKDLSVFVHVVSESGALVAQQDSGPDHDRRPTSEWRPGETIEDQHVVSLPVSLPVGRYTVLAGLYDWETGERLFATEPGGLRWPEDAIVLASIEVQGVHGP